MPPESFPIGLVIQFVEVAQMAEVSPAERLIDEGRLIRDAERQPRTAAVVQRMSPQKRVLAKLALGAVSRYPELMFRAMFEGWSTHKVRFEINKRDNKGGKKDTGE